MKKLHILIIILLIGLMACPVFGGYNPLKPATDSETITGTATDKVVTPAGLSAMIAHNFNPAKGSDVASAGAMTLGDGNLFDITGTTTINTIATKGIGTTVVLEFDGALQLTHSADLFLPSAANITTAAGDIAALYEYASGDWRCYNYMRADGTSLVATDLASPGAIGGTTPDELWGILDVNDYTDVTIDVPAISHYGGVIFNNDAGAIEYDLDPALVGMSITLVDAAGGAMSADPNGTETITYDGVTAAAGEILISSGTIGDFLTLICITAGEWMSVGHDSNGWVEATP